MSRELLQQALGALLDAQKQLTLEFTEPYIYQKEIAALETELAKPDRKYPNHKTYCGTCGACTYKPWVSFSDDVVAMIEKTVVTRKQAIKMIEHHLKELNT